MKKYLVGGAVRDKLLHLPVTERDWVVVGTTTQEMLAQGYQQVGKNFPVFLHPENREEYALARAERKYGQGYTGFICYTSPSVTLEEDLLRRDLTINAIACDEQGNIIDPYHGQKDICQRWLRHVSAAFSDDSLRVLRVARFAARFAHLSFRIAPSTLYLMQNMNTELSLISPERVWKETERALATKNPQVYFKVLHDCGALKVLFPEIEALFHVSAPIKLHQNINLGRHTLIKLAIVASLSEDIAVRFAIICHDLGKNITPRELWSNHKIHNKTSIKLLDNLCKRLKVPNYLHNLATMIIKYHNLLHGAESLTPKKLIKLFNAIDVWRRPNRLEQMIIISEADARRSICLKKYSLGNFLRKAYRITTSISVDKVIAEGLIGNQISKELCLRRQQALALWKRQQ